MAGIEFYEQIVSKNFGKNKKIAFVLSIIGFILLAVGIFVFVVGVTMENVGLIAIIGAVMLAVGFFIWIRKDYVNCEYEYDFAYGDLEIARILNNTKRSVLVKFEVSEISVIGVTTQKNYNRFLSMPSYKKIYASLSRKPSKDLYFVVVNNYLLHFSPNSELLSGIKRYLKVRIGD